MQQISTSIPESRIGGRIGSQRLRETLAFNTIDETVGRYDLLLLVKRIGRQAGFTPRMIQLLDYYINFTRDIDWEEGGQPIVYQSLAKTALDLGVDERQIQRLEKALFEVGALTWNDSGNHKRYGTRCAETGAILYAYGVDLTPLSKIKKELESKLHEKQLYDKNWLETKRQISFYRSQIRASLGEAFEMKHDKAVEWGEAYDDLAIKIRTHMKLPALSALLKAHKALHSVITGELSLNDTDQGTQETSCRDGETVVHSKYTKNKISNKLESNSSVISFSDEGSNGDHNLEDKQADEAETEDIDVLRSAGLQHITLQQAVGATSERFRNYLPLDDKNLTWADFIEAAFRLKNELNISQTSWGRGCEILGTSGAALSVLLTDHSTQRSFNPIENANGYFCAMMDRARSGELKLHNSIFGLLKNGEKN